MSLYRSDEIPAEKLNDTLSRKLVVGKNEMLSFLYFKKGGVVESHKHINEQITYLLKGRLKMVVDEKIFIIKKGDILHILPNQVHSAESLEDSKILDIFSPIREDFLNKTDYYLRKDVRASGKSRQGNKEKVRRKR